MTDQPSFTFVWTIKNFSLCHAWKDYRSIYSPKFYVPGLEREFCLRIFPHGEEKSPNHIELYLVNSYNEPVTADYELSFLSADDIPRVTYRDLKALAGFQSTRMENCPTREVVFVTKRSVFLPEGTLKVRCRIWIPRKMNVEPLIICAIGDVCKAKLTTEFSISDFSNRRVIETHTVQSNYPFSPKDSFLILTLSGKASKPEEEEFDLKVTSNIYADACQLTLVDKFGETVKSQLNTDHHFFSDKIYCFVFKKFISRKQVFEKEKEFLDGFTLPILCDLFTLEYFNVTRRFSNETTFPRNSSTFACETSEFRSSRPSNSVTSSFDPSPLNVLQQDFLSLYTERKLCDFELRTEDTSFPVHKLILSARSPVFGALFASDMKEAASGVQDIPDIDKGTLERMLIYIYTGVIQEYQWEEAVKLYYAADKYEILSLKQMCSSYLQKNVNSSNVCEVLGLADRHNDQALNSAVEEFLVDHAEEIMKSEEWRTFTNRYPLLAAETMRKMFSTVRISRK